jgi:hypothetical protein
MSNPYELRFKVLEMARDAEMLNYDVKMNAYWSLYNDINDLMKKLNAMRGKRFDDAFERLVQLLSKIEKSFPEMPTSEAIKTKASELYEFVEQNGK